MTTLKTKLTEDHIDTIIEKAFSEAKKAADTYVAEHGDNGACGFAWVKIKPARGQIFKRLKEIGLAEKAFDGGYDVWNPSKSPVQSIVPKTLGAIAFARVLTEAGTLCIAKDAMD